MPAVVRKLCVSLAALVVVLLVVEVGFRLYTYGPRGLSYELLSSVKPMGRHFVRAAEHPAIGYELKDGVDQLFKMVPFTTNAHGLRDRDYARAKPAGAFRVAVIGDSFTMGSGVAIENVYHSLLEQRMDATEFINFGVGGYGLPEYLAVFEHKVQAWNPDLVLLALSFNDRYDLRSKARRGASAAGDETERRRAARDRQKQLREPAPAARAPEAPAPARSNGFYFRLHSLVAAADIVQHALGQRSDEPGGAPGENAARANRLYLERSFERLARIRGASDVPVFVVFLNMRQDETALETGELFAEQCAAQDIPYLDTSPLFRDKGLWDFAIFHNDYHPNEAANLRFADALEPRLAELR